MVAVMDWPEYKEVVFPLAKMVTEIRRYLQYSAFPCTAKDICSTFKIRDATELMSIIEVLGVDALLIDISSNTDEKISLN